MLDGRGGADKNLGCKGSKLYRQVEISCEASDFV